MSNIPSAHRQGNAASPNPPSDNDSLAKQLHDLFFEHKVDGVVVGVAGVQQELSSRAQAAAQSVLGTVKQYLPSFASNSTASAGQRLGGGPLPTDNAALRQRRVEYLDRSPSGDTVAAALEETTPFSAGEFIKSIGALLNYRGFAQKLGSDLLVGFFSGEDPHLTVIKSIAGYSSALGTVAVLGENSTVAQESKNAFPGSVHQLGGENAGPLSQEELHDLMYQGAFERLVAACAERASEPASSEQLNRFKTVVGEESYNRFMEPFSNQENRPTQDDLTIELNRPTWRWNPDSAQAKREKNLEEAKEKFLRAAREVAPKIVPMIGSLTASDLAQGKFADAGEVGEEVIKAILRASQTL
ncbi:MAG: hypothetical protein ACOYK6_00760 [Chthoniobacterales bacterium]